MILFMNRRKAEEYAEKFGVRILSKKKFPDYVKTRKNHTFHNGHFKESYRHDEFSFIDLGNMWVVGLEDDIKRLRSALRKSNEEILLEEGKVDCFEGVCKLS